MGTNARARSVVLHKFDPTSTEMQLLVGLTNGAMLAFVVTSSGSKPQDRKIFAMGNMPVTLVKVMVDGHSSVLASGSRSVVVFWEKGRLKTSPVMLNVRRLPLQCRIMR